MKDMYAELFFIAGIIPLWLTSLDFRNMVYEECAQFSQRKLGWKRGYLRKTRSMKLYLKVSRLSRLFSRGHGYALLCYFANYLMYYSTKIDTLFLPRTTAGGKVYELEYLCTVSIVYGLGASFAYQVSQFDIQVRT